MPTQNQLPSFFVSYRREDSGVWARLIANYLGSEVGEDRVFLDVDDINPGSVFGRALRDGLNECDVLLALIGPQWLNAQKNGRFRLDDPQDFVRFEIRLALRRRIRVIPLLIGGARMPEAGELPKDLQGLTQREAVTLTDANFDAAIDNILEISRQDLAKRTVNTKRQWRTPARLDQDTRRNEFGRKKSMVDYRPMVEDWIRANRALAFWILLMILFALSPLFFWPRESAHKKHSAKFSEGLSRIELTAR
jgi:hypothetical protein